MQVYPSMWAERGGAPTASRAPAAAGGHPLNACITHLPTPHLALFHPTTQATLTPTSSPHVFTIDKMLLPGAWATALF
jgi:hypothetical protein